MNEETLFELALNTPPAELPALLDRECANDPVLRKRIEKLLAAHLSSDGTWESVTEHTRGGTQDRAGLEVRPKDTVIGSVLGGKYKLIESIGHGGMGNVFMAQQTEPVKRLVAVKVIKAGMDSRAVLARFDAERQALAMMDHPNIAKVLDAGATELGSPYFVMELVKGVPITKFCDDNKLTPRQRLELFLPVCEAIQHSHQKGIIHRDIKPSNVLVAMYDDRAVPKVIDFGVAKATGQALADVDLVTGFGSLVGTPEYMSPEQAGFNNLDIDTRTDIYSLGVLLYELLSGHTPVDRKSMEKAAVIEILRIVRDVEAPLLSAKLSSINTLPNVAANRQTEPKKLATQFRGELDWVLHKALEKDRARRYSTANGLASDIQRYLADEIVEARPPSKLYKLQKFFKRNQGQVLAASLVLLSLLAGFAGTTWGLIRAEHRRVEAEGARSEEATQRSIAQANEAQAVLAKEEEGRQRTIAETEKQRAIESRNRALDALRATTGEDVEKLIGEKKVLSPNERAYLEAIAQRWQVFADQEGNDKLSRDIRGEGHLRVANLWDHLGRREDALLEHEQAEKIYQELTTEFPKENIYAESLATCLNNFGLVLNHLGRRVEALTKIRTGLAIQTKLADEFPDKSDYGVALAGSYHNVALVNDALGNRSEALESYLKGMEIEEKLANLFPDRPNYRQRLATSHSNLGVLLVGMGKHQDAQSQYDKAIAIREKLAADFPTQREHVVDLATSHNNYGNLLSTLGQSEEAVQRYRSAVGFKQKLVADYPGVPEYNNSLASTYLNLGSTLRKIGQTAEAVSVYRQSLAIRENLTKTFPFEPEYQQDLAATCNNLANLLREVNKLDLASEMHLKAIAIREKLVSDFAAVPEYRKNLATSHINLGQLLSKMDKPNEAEAAYRQSLDILKQLTAEFPEVTAYADNLASNYNSLANLLANKGMLEEALELYRQATTIRERLVSEYPTVPEYKVTLAGVYVNTANKLFEADKPTDSLVWFQKAIDLLGPVNESAAKSSKSARDLRECYEGRSMALDKLQRYPEGKEDWDKYIALSPPEDKTILLTKRWKRLVKQGMANDVTASEALERIAELTKLTNQAPNLWYEYACVYSLAADRLPEKEKEYSDRAIELLTQAVQTGYSNAKNMVADSDLKRLRDRDDFKKLVAEVESKGKPE